MRRTHVPVRRFGGNRRLKKAKFRPATEYKLFFLLPNPKSGVLCSADTMRRLLTLFVLLLTGCTALEPLWLTPVLNAASVPVCCQKHGKHHCTGSGEDSSPDAIPHLRALSAVCPHHGRTLIVTSHFQLEPSATVQPLPCVFSRLSSIDDASSHELTPRRLFDRGPPQFSYLA